MSWWNPWGEAARLRKELAYQTNRAQANAERALSNDIIIARKTRENADLSVQLEQAIWEKTEARLKLQQVSGTRK